MTTYFWGLLVVLTMLGGRDIMGDDDKGVFGQNGWLVNCGCEGDTESGDSWKRCPMDIGSVGLVEALSASCEP